MRRILLAILLTGLFAGLSGFAEERPGNPAERGEPTVSDQKHPEQPGPGKPADGVPTRKGEMQGLETVHRDRIHDAVLAVVVVSAAIVFLALLFSTLSTSPSRDPSRHPKTH